MFARLAVAIVLFTAAHIVSAVRTKNDFSQSDTVGVTGKCKAPGQEAPAQFSYHLIYDIQNAKSYQEHVQRYKKTIKVAQRSSITTFRNFQRIVESGYKQSASMKLKMKGMGGDSKSSFFFNIKTKLEEGFTKSVTKESSFEEEQELYRKVTIEPGQSVRLYQEIITMNGVEAKGALVNNPGASESFRVIGEVQFDFSFVEPVIELLGRTKPGKHNKLEWKAIRDTVIDNMHHDLPTQVEQILRQFTRTSPGRHNKDEWAELRRKSRRILNNDLSECHSTIKKFLYMLGGISPGRSNKGEWSAIRAAAYRARLKM